MAKKKREKDIITADKAPGHAGAVERPHAFRGLLNRQAVHLVLILVVGLAAYSNTFNAPFQFDDLEFIKNNPVITSLDNFFLNARGYAYHSRRFIAYLTFALNYHFNGYDVAGYHIVNLAVHVINAMLVYFLVLLTFRTASLHNSRFTPHASRFTKFIALFSALLFVAHPVQTQAVTYIYQRLTSLATMFYLLSVVTYVMARSAGRTASKGPGRSASGLRSAGLYAASLTSAVLAMKTKEIAFTLPIIIVLYEFVFFRSGFKKKLLFVLPVLATLVIIPISMIGVHKPLGELLSDISEKARLQTEMPRWDYLMTQMRVITTYIRLLFFPAGQNLDYDYPLSHSFFEPPVLLSFLFLSSLAGLGVYFLKQGRRGPPDADPARSWYFSLAGFGIFWFFITLAVESSVIPIVDVIFEHRMYLPSIGFFLAVTAGIYAAGSRSGEHSSVARELAVPLAFMTAVLVFAGAAFERNRTWGDPGALWEDVIAKSPDKPRGYNNLGMVQMGEGHYPEAIRMFERAISLSPAYWQYYLNRGYAYTEMGLVDKALEDFDRVLALDPKSYQACANKGMAYGRAGQLDRAIEQFTRAIDLSPDTGLAYGNRGLAYSLKGDYGRALKDLDKAIELDNAYSEAYGGRANIYLKTGRKDLAVSDLRKACDLGDMKGCNALRALGGSVNR